MLILKDPEYRWMAESFRDTFAGIVGGIACVYSTQPLDTTKVKMQIYPDQYRSIFQTVYKTFRSEGIRGLYAGSVPAVLANIGESATAFLTYGRISIVMQNWSGVSSHDQLSLASKTMCGAFTGITASFVLAPTELVKCRLQTQYITGQVSVGVPKTPFAMAWHIISKEGPLQIMQGWGLTCARITWGNSFFFGGYEASLVLLNAKQDGELSFWKTAIAGGIGGTLCWAFGYPIDVVKSRVQVATKGNLTACSAATLVYRTVGLRGFFNGMTPCLIRAFPACAALFVAVEYTKETFDYVFLN